MNETFHLVPADYYRGLDPGGPYLPAGYEGDGFIHCTDGLKNVLQIGNWNYKDDPREYLLLVIDKERVGAPIQYEDEEGIYPHIYGPVPRDAIRAALPVPRAPMDRSYLRMRWGETSGARGAISGDGSAPSLPRRAGRRRQGMRRGSVPGKRPAPTACRRRLHHRGPRPRPGRYAAHQGQGLLRTYFPELKLG